jgi:hypothetical protein
MDLVSVWKPENWLCSAQSSSDEGHHHHRFAQAAPQVLWLPVKARAHLHILADMNQSLPPK